MLKNSREHITGEENKKKLFDNERKAKIKCKDKIESIGVNGKTTNAISTKYVPV